MKILVSTKETQGQRDNDFCWTDEDEHLTLLKFVCDKDVGKPDGPCGCNRSFTGISTRKGTTTAVVVTTTLSRNDIIWQMSQSHSRAVWAIQGIPVRCSPDIKRKLANDLRKIQKYPVGTILEYRDGKLGVRPNFDQISDLLSAVRSS